MATPFAPPAPDECSAALPAWSAPDADECTAVFGSDSRWQRIRLQGLEAFGSDEPNVKISRDFLQPPGLDASEIGPHTPPSRQVTAQLPDLPVIPPGRLTARLPIAGVPVVAYGVPPPVYLVAGGFDSLAHGGTVIDWLSFGVQVPGIYEDGISPKAPAHNKVSARLLDDYEVPPETRVTVRLSVPGAPTVDRFFAPATQHSSTYGADSAQFGIPAVVGDQLVFPAGWDNFASGGQRVWNRDTYLLHGGDDYAAVGGAIVWLRTRYLLLSGFSHTAHGSQRISHFLQYAALAGYGIAPPDVIGPWVSRSPRYLEVDTRFDFPPVIDVSHTVGGTRYIEPFGWDSQRFLTRILPETQIVNPAGLRAMVFSDPEVELWKRYVFPGGFPSRPAALVFGAFYVWNLRQYIHHAVDEENPADHLNPPAVGEDTILRNRNRTVVPVGERSDRHGYTRIYNNARAIAPPGTPAPTPEPFKPYGFVTHWLQPVSPAGVESVYFGRWAVVANDARLVRPSGAKFDAYGLPEVIDTTQWVLFAGAGNVQAFGGGLVAYAIREITFDERYTIGPPYNTGHVTWNWRTYLRDVSAANQHKMGEPPWVRERWNIIRPWWSEPAPWLKIGEPFVRNLTPELGARGTAFEAWGQPLVRNEWEAYRIEGTSTQSFGQHLIRDRRHWAYPLGGPPPAIMPGPTLTKFGGMPETQNIIMYDELRRDFMVVPLPRMNYQFVYVKDEQYMHVGEPDVRLMGIIVDPGIAERQVDKFGAARVELKNRALLDAGDIDNYIQMGEEQRLSPHTVYAVMEAPAQAIANHPIVSRRFVDHDTFGRLLKGPGVPTVSFRYRQVRPSGFAWPGYLDPLRNPNPPHPKVTNKRQYVIANGIQSLGVGWVEIPGTQVVDLDQFAPLTEDFGEHEVAPPPYVGPRTFPQNGLDALEFGAHEVDFLHRRRAAQGWDSQALGTVKPGDTPHMWQGLRVGPHIPTVIGDAKFDSYGEPWVSLAVRTLEAVGLDGLEIGYDFNNFRGRMRVRNADVHTPATQQIIVREMRPPFVSVPAARLLRHYIRPDGDADQFRKNHTGVGSPVVAGP